MNKKEIHEHAIYTGVVTNVSAHYYYTGSLLLVSTSFVSDARMRSYLCLGCVIIERLSVEWLNLVSAIIFSPKNWLFSK